MFAEQVRGDLHGSIALGFPTDHPGEGRHLEKDPDDVVEVSIGASDFVEAVSKLTSGCRTG